MFARKPLLPQKRTMRNLWLAPAMSSMDNWVEDVETFAYLLTAADITRLVWSLPPDRAK
jgi:hypothetical protein